MPHFNLDFLGGYICRHLRSIENLQLQLAWLQLHGTHCWGYTVRLQGPGRLSGKALGKAKPIAAQPSEHFIGQLAARALVEATGQDATVYSPEQVKRAEALIVTALTAGQTNTGWN